MATITLTSFIVYVILCGIAVLLMLTVIISKNKLSDKIAVIVFIAFVGISIVAAIALLVSQVSFATLIIDWLS